MEIIEEISLNKILDEARLRDKQRDKSVIDQGFGEIKESVFLIDGYISKSDLANKFIENMPLYYDNAGIWWRWIERKKLWEKVDEVDILNLIQLSSYANIISSKERIEIVNALKQRARRNKPKDPKKSWIQFQGEIIDLETGERLEATSKYFVKNPIPHKLGRSPETPIMDRIFEEWVGKEYVKTLYEIIAYCLLPDYPMHRLFCFIGAGMNGKSCYLSLLRKFIGEYNCCSTELDTLLNSRFEVTRLHNKLVCQMGETNFNEMKKTSMLKKLTGGDLIGFEYKNKTPFEAINYAKIIIATNNLPTTDDKTLGFYRRWLIIDFPNHFSEAKNILDEIPPEEYEALAIKSVGILMELLDKREFHNEGNIEERAKKYEDRSDPLQKFLDDNIQNDANSYITKADFMRKLTEWLKEHRFREMAENSVGKRMKDKGFSWVKKSFEWMNDGKGGQAKVWSDIKWKE